MIDITCGDCGARFRLDAALMKGAKGGRVRCRKCGGHIVVLRPEEPPVLSVDDLLPMDTEVPALDPREAGAGEDGRREPPPPQKADADLPPPPEASGPSEEIVPPGPERAVTPGGRSHTPKYLLFGGLAILLLAGGTYYFGGTKSLREGLGRFVPGSGATRPGSVAEKPPYDIRNVKTHVDNSPAGGSLFVIRGSVANVGNVPSAGIRIQATLLGKDNEALAEKAAFAGNPLDEASLRRMDRAGIDAAMSNRSGEGNGNKEIPAGKSLPFLVVFFDPPGGNRSGHGEGDRCAIRNIIGMDRKIFPHTWTILTCIMFYFSIYRNILNIWSTAITNALNVKDLAYGMHYGR